MTAQNRTALKALFETGDTLLQTSFDNLIDSFLSLTDTGAQTIASNITFSSPVTFTTAVTLTGGISGDLGFTGIINGSVNASIAALGTSSTSAAPVSAFVNILQRVSAGTNDGIRLSNMASGVVQYIINNVSATAILYSRDDVVPNHRIDGASSIKIMPNQRITIIGATLSSCYSMIGAQAGV